MWAPIPPSSFLTLGGATILLNLSASNELVSKAEYRKALLCTQASRSLCAYAYASAGVGESTQDALFGGHSMICERSAVLAEQQPFQRDPSLIIADADMELLITERRKQTSYMAQAKETLPPLREIPIHLPEQKLDQLLRKINPYPFVPANDAQLSQRCHTIFQIQANALAKTDGAYPRRKYGHWYFRRFRFYLSAFSSRGGMPYSGAGSKKPFWA